MITVTNDTLAVRPLRAGDGDACRALLAAAARDTPYAARLLELLAQALAGGDAEVRGLVAVRQGEIEALALHGIVAGSIGAGRLHCLVARPAAEDGDEDAAALLLRSVDASARSAGARFLVAELPDDPAAAALAAPLRRHGFHEEARVADFFRDGIDLLFLRLALADGPA